MFTVINDCEVDFSPQEITLDKSDIGEGKVVNVTLTDKLGIWSEYTLYFEAKGIFIY